MQMTEIFNLGCIPKHDSYVLCWCKKNWKFEETSHIMKKRRVMCDSMKLTLTWCLWIWFWASFVFSYVVSTNIL